MCAVASQDLLVESVTHEAHTGHLVEMVRKVSDAITCTPLESRVTAHHQRTTALRQDVGRLLERLEELHVHWSAYQTQMDKLQEWCSQAKTSLHEIDLTPQDQEKLREQFNQIWVSLLPGRSGRGLAGTLGSRLSFICVEYLFYMLCVYFLLPLFCDIFSC